MNKENTKRLFEDFPRLFRGRHRSVTQSAMPFGIDCEDGWFTLLYGLCESITAYAAVAGLDPLAVQCKEKYGSLRLYVEDGDIYIDTLCLDAEWRSMSICELCGEPGALRTDRPWIVTRCDKHSGESRTCFA